MAQAEVATAAGTHPMMHKLSQAEQDVADTEKQVLLLAQLCAQHP